MFGHNVNQQKRPMDFTGGQQGWGTPVADDGFHGGAHSERKRKKRSRWANDESVDKTVIPGMPTIIPANLSKEQERQYLCKQDKLTLSITTSVSYHRAADKKKTPLHLQIEEISRRLRTGDLGIAPNPEDRSPSPEPIYNNEGKRLNTREYRTRKRLEEDRHKLVQEAMGLNTDYKPPADYKPPVIRVNDKVMIPQEEHPDINFVGLLIGPRGNTLKTLEKETGAKIIIRGKGSVKDGKIGRKDGQPLPGEDEPLHAYVTANNPENVRKAVEKIKAIIKESVEVPEGQNDLRKQQLRELALLNGTLRENDGLAKLKQIQQAQTIVTNTIICTNCGGTGHLGKDCKQQRPGDTFRNMMQHEAPPADKAKMDSEYMSLMAELGEGPPPSNKGNSMLPGPQRSQFHHHHHHHHQHPHQSRFTSPPPNPMASFSNFQGNMNKSGPPPSMLSGRPPMGSPAPQAPQPPPQNPAMFQSPPPIPHPQQGLPAGIQPPGQMQPPHLQHQQQQHQQHQHQQQQQQPPPQGLHQQPPPQQQPPQQQPQHQQLQQQQQQPQPGGIPQQYQQLQQQAVVSTTPQPVAPPTSISAGFQPSLQMTVPAPVAPVPPPQVSQQFTSHAAPVPPPVWSSAPTVSQITTNPTQSQPPSVAVPPPPTTLMTAPPPPPPSSQTPSTMSNMPWLQQGSVPPPPPQTSQAQWQSVPPPPPASMAQVPWQQVPPPPMQSMPSSVAPPPPPPASTQTYSMPPPPPTGYDPSQMSGVNQLLVAPPPPPPN